MKTMAFLRMLTVMVILAAMGSLHVSPALAQAPANDDFDDASTIEVLPFSDSVDTSEASTAPDDPELSCVGTSHTVWYQFTPSDDMRLAANTFGSDYDTTLSVFTGVRGALVEVACNDDSFFSVESQVAFDALAGETYYFMAGSFFDSPGGNLVFNLDVAGPPLEFDLQVNPVATVKPKTGVVMLSGTVTCSRPASAQIFGDLTQPAGRVFIRGFFFTFVECDGETPWSAVAVGENGIFVGGKADAAVFADAFTPDGEFAFDQEFLTLRLRGAGGKP